MSPPRQPNADPAFPDTRNVLEPECARCPALVEHRECISWGTGPLDADVLVIGEAPGYGNPTADRWRGGNWTGKSYTSRHSGRLIRRLIADLGYDDRTYYTNAVKCFPADPSDPTTNREPTATERSTCRDHLLAEVDTIEPDVLLATGRHATASILEVEGSQLEGFLEAALEPVHCRSLDTWLLPILHPSYQAVWLGRLGYDREEYLEEIGGRLDELCGDG